LKNKLVINTAMLYIMNIAKLVFPFLTLPYLTRVLSVEGYAMVSYVKSVMQYMQLTVDFGFMLSATTAIVAACGDRKKIGSIVSHTILAKLLLCAAALAVLAGMTASIDLLRQNGMYVFLSFVTVALSAFLVDYLFRGLADAGDHHSLCHHERHCHGADLPVCPQRCGPAVDSRAGYSGYTGVSGPGMGQGTQI
jgi:PST family polysaccharide transporter